MMVKEQRSNGRFLRVIVIAWAAAAFVSGLCLTRLMQRRPWLTHHYNVVASIRDVPAARRHLDWYVEQVERDGLTRGNTALFAPTPKQDLGLWYGRLREVQTQLVRVEPVADPAARAAAMRRFSEVFRTTPDFIQPYPYHRLNMASGAMTTFLSVVLVIASFRHGRSVQRLSPA